MRLLLVICLGVMGCSQPAKPIPVDPPPTKEPRLDPEITKRHIKATRDFILKLDDLCQLYRTDYGTYPPATDDGDIATLHKHLGGDRKVVLMRTPEGDIVADKPPFMDFLPEQLEGKPTETAPNPPKRVIDAWGRPLHYRFPGMRNPKEFDIWSDGPDPRDPTGVIGNWER